MRTSREIHYFMLSSSQGYLTDLFLKTPVLIKSRALVLYPCVNMSLKKVWTVIKNTLDNAYTEKRYTLFHIETHDFKLKDVESKFSVMN